MPVLLIIDFMAACFTLGLYSVSKEYWAFLIPHAFGIFEAGFGFCIIMSWNFVYKKKMPVRRFAELIKERASRDATSKTVESFIDPKEVFGSVSVGCERDYGERLEGCANKQVEKEVSVFN
eukprot:TRINITY_DN10459_c0_g1_i2.p3 TRINITY_DN10459_c0_g1~~TRINITY_DN10459_c0_g1_i2.p3  ORF type:complete len:121 (-),score=17.47 TRINITY_DN10459_c0_g1_i2:124-486(-)